MVHNGLGQLHAHNDDDMDDDQWRLSSKKDISSNASKGEQSGLGVGGSQLHTGKLQHEDAESREFLLRNELESVRKVNEAIEGVIASLDKAKSSMRVSLPALDLLMAH